MIPLYLRKQPPGVETLERLKRYNGIRQKWIGKKVYIFSEEYFAFWRPDAAGYTTIQDKAGIYDFEDAWKNSAHCDPSKGITYRLI